MPVALAGRAPATFEIKSANLPLVSLLLKSHDLKALAAELAERYGDIPDFFDNDPLVVDLTPLQAQPGDVDFPALQKLLRGHRLMPVAARGGSEGQMRAALAAGLAPGGDALPQGLRQPERAEVPGERGGTDFDALARGMESLRALGGDASAKAPPPPAAPPLEAVSALVIEKPLRSGQQVYARGRDLVVFSPVNPGAEVIADGHIHVYAPMRGKAIAGAKGNTAARIVALSLEPELISIAGVYRTSEVPLPAEVLGKPTQVRLQGGADGKLVMEPLQKR